jgi:hypothetical protein
VTGSAFGTDRKRGLEGKERVPGGEGRGLRVEGGKGKGTKSAHGAGWLSLLLVYLEGSERPTASSRG